MSEFYQQYGPTALVTGASSGIGDAFARDLAARGFDLLLVARRASRLEALAQTLRQMHGVTVTTLVEDLAEPAAPGRVLAAALDQDVGLVVSNAGFGLKGPHEGQEPEALTAMLNVNCHAPLQLSRGLIPALRDRGRGGFIVTSSVEGLIGVPYSAAYAASKAFTNSLAEGLWGELREYGVDVLALCPGSTDTEAHDLQGIDRASLQGMMSPAAVAREGLEALGGAPVHVAGEQNRDMFRGLLSLPREEALLAMKDNMRAALLPQQ